jgi:hypothetical protein
MTNLTAKASSSGEHCPGHMILAPTTDGMIFKKITNNLEVT